MKYKNLLDIVVLAAGKGSRMKSKTLPKPLHTLNGIPMINYLLNHLPLSIFANKFIIVPDKHSEIKKTVLQSDNSFKYIKQLEPRGTGDALLLALDSLESENIIGSTNYGNDFCSAYGLDNYVGVQFHPEKSGNLGLQIFDNFINKFI